eukprot:SAG11_NODE_10067_length_859_cov_1.118421_1_plen_112_part_00
MQIAHALWSEPGSPRHIAGSQDRHPRYPHLDEMATIKKLSIQGIRSFSPDDPQVIQFQKPLTLIVGSNGAGKTTVIECIKMALTGELPPDADRGKNFVHDPRVSAARDTKA